jgi:hypothetical protein
MLSNQQPNLDAHEDNREYIRRPSDNFQFEVSPDLFQENSLSEADCITSAHQRREIIRIIIRDRNLF